MSTARKNLTMLPTYFGAGFGFIAFLIAGAVPGLLYGGYMGLVMASVLLGAPVEATLLAKIITGGGMLLGLVASLFFFAVVGALLGTVIGMPFMPLLRKAAQAETDDAAQPVKA